MENSEIIQIRYTSYDSFTKKYIFDIPHINNYIQILDANVEIFYFDHSMGLSDGNTIINFKEYPSAMVRVKKQGASNISIRGWNKNF